MLSCVTAYVPRNWQTPCYMISLDIVFLQFSLLRGTVANRDLKLRHFWWILRQLVVGKHEEHLDIICMHGLSHSEEIQKLFHAQYE